MDRALDLFASHQVAESGHEAPGAAPADPDEAVVGDTRRACAEALAASALAGVHAVEQESPEDVAVVWIALREGMSTLRPHEREVIRLGLEEGLTIDEVAARVGIHANTAQRRSASAVRKLRAFLVGDAGPAGRPGPRED